MVKYRSVDDCRLGLSLGSLGTETDGSLVLPASYNNIVAIKPSTSMYHSLLIIFILINHSRWADIETHGITR